MTDTKVHKSNVTAYLSIDVIDKLDDLAKVEKCSRNNLFEEAILDFLKKKNEDSI